jgi:thiosulfate/3-mercaptopyruvate sulfurtransferase
MKRNLISFLLLVCSSSLWAQDQSILVSASWLKENLSDPKTIVLQVTGMKYDYDKEHIAGARYLWPPLLAPDSPYGAFNAPDAKAATEVLRALGINNDSHIVLCHVRNEVSVTARMFLTLENLGLRGRVSFLNGGLEAWKKEGYAVTKELPVVKKGKIKIEPGAILVDKNYVLNSLKSDKATVVDARMKIYYDGDPTGNPRDGHITGAKNIPYPDLLDATNLYQFKPIDQLEGYFGPVVPDKKNEIVTYCFIGQTASVVYMAGRILGYEVKLYDGSLQEWSRLDELPMEKTVK